MGALFSLLGSAIFWVATACVAFLWLPLTFLVWLATAWLDPGRFAVGLLLQFGGVVATALQPLWRLRLSGRWIADPRRPYVVVANHESMADIFAICHLPWGMKWLAKREVFWIPPVGPMMAMAGFVGVVRKDRTSRARAFELCRRRLEQRCPILIFPEGTRAVTRDLLPFRDGAFRLAIEAQVPILPVVVAGTRQVWPKGSLRLRPGRVRVHVLDPVPTEGLTDADVPVLREEVRRRIARAREELWREMGLLQPEREGTAQPARSSAHQSTT